MAQKLSLLSGAIAVVLATAPMLPTFAQSAPTDSSGNNRLVIERLGDKLNLTEDQKAKIKQIRESTRAQIETVLTDEQKAKLRAAREEGQKMRKDMASLNLTDDQKAKIRSIRQEAKKQMDAVLTDQQRQQLQQERQQHHQRRSNQSGT